MRLIRAVVPNLGSMDPLVVHRRYQGVHRIRNFVLRLIGGSPQNIGTLILGVHSQKRLKIAGLGNNFSRKKKHFKKGGWHTS